MSKFDKYFTINCSSASPFQTLIFPTNQQLEVYDKFVIEYYLIKVSQECWDPSKITRLYYLQEIYGEYSWVTQDENEIFLPEEITKLGKLLYV